MPSIGNIKVKVSSNNVIQSTKPVTLRTPVNRLDALADVEELTPAEGDTLVYRQSDDRWVARPNKPRTKSVVTSATPTPNYDTEDKFFITALAENPTFGAPTGTYIGDGALLLFRIKDDGVQRVLTWNAIYRAGSQLPLPAQTTVGKLMSVGFMYNATDNKWDLIAFVNGI